MLVPVKPFYPGLIFAIKANIYVRCGTNTLAYLASSSATKRKKKFYDILDWLRGIKSVRLEQFYVI
jgi:hypothetical protein